MEPEVSLELRKKLEVYLHIANEGHAASDLYRKQQPDKTLQEYIQSLIDLTVKSMGVDQANIASRVILFL